MPPSPPVVLIAGALHYDIMVEATHLPRRDETAVGQRWYPKFGGKGGNQAVAVARTGTGARMLGALGQDDFGSFLRKCLRAAGVEDYFVADIPGVGSGMSVAIQDQAGDYAATIVSGANQDIDPAAASDNQLWQDVALLILQNEVPPALNLAVATQARARALPVLLNAAPVRTIDPALAALVDIIVVNAVEAEMMSAQVVRDRTSAAQAAAVLGVQFPTVIVTAGAHGLAAQDAQGNFTLSAQMVQVRSSHGAGDAFIGHLAAALLAGQSLRAACQAASLGAAAHVSRPLDR